MKKKFNWITESENRKNVATIAYTFSRAFAGKREKKIGQHHNYFPHPVWSIFPLLRKKEMKMWKFDLLQKENYAKVISYHLCISFRSITIYCYWYGYYFFFFFDSVGSTISVLIIARRQRHTSDGVRLNRVCVCVSLLLYLSHETTFILPNFPNLK